MYVVTGVFIVLGTRWNPPPYKQRENVVLPLWLALHCTVGSLLQISLVGRNYASLNSILNLVEIHSSLCILIQLHILSVIVTFYINNLFCIEELSWAFSSFFKFHVRLSPLSTVATNWLIVPAPNYRWVWSIWWNKNWQGNQSTWRQPVTVPLCPPQMPRDLTRIEPGLPWWEAGD
jgi:hypothetical protein